jgi:holo-[acyl-carrier protein] synthase
MLDSYGDRFRQRVYTPGEIAYCDAKEKRGAAASYAARFAAKEAGMKALGSGLRLGVTWRDLEVRRAPDQAPTLELHGRTRELGLARGGRRMLLSLSHDGDYALAHALLVDDDPAVGVDPATR